MPQRLTLRSQVDLVSAYETLREAILSSGDGATTPAHAWRLIQEGLLAWGLCAGAARDGDAVADVTNRTDARSPVARPRIHAGRGREASARRDAAGHR